MSTEEFISNLKEIQTDNFYNNGENKTLYEFVAANYYKMDKEQLKELVLNLDYILWKYESERDYLRLENAAIQETIERMED